MYKYIIAYFIIMVAVLLTPEEISNIAIWQYSLIAILSAVGIMSLIGVEKYGK